MLIRNSALVRMMPVIVAIAATVAATGCATKTSDRDLVFLDSSEAITAVRGERRMLRSPTAGVWLDPRTDREFRDGHIPSAVNIPLERLRENHASLRQYDLIVVYGSDFNSPRATVASKMLMELGHGDVRTLRGGLKAWKEAGHSIESGEAAR